MLLVWPIAVALHGGRFGLALLLFIVAGISDVLDGYLAKRFGWTSELGKVLDPMADKLLLIILFVEAAWLGRLVWWLAAAVVARDVFIALGAGVFRLWFGPLHGQPTVLSKINTGMQLLFMALVMLNAGLTFPPQKLLDGLAVLVFVTTVLSGLGYLSIFTRRAWSQPAGSH